MGSRRTTNLIAKARQCPPKPGVYYHKDDPGRIIYVGKAVNLRSRVGSYFRGLDRQSVKTQALVGEIADFDYSISANEIEALFYGAEMIRRYQPKYNTAGRKQVRNGLYVRLDTTGPAPSLTTVDQPASDGANHYGPYLDRRALACLRSIFPFSSHIRLPSWACLQVHLGLCPGPETSDFDRPKAIDNLGNIRRYLTGRSASIQTSLRGQMDLAASQPETLIGPPERFNLQDELIRRLSATVQVSGRFVSLQLPPANPALLLLRQIRDESHRFALSYHSQLKTKRQTTNPLLEVDGIGPATCRRLMDQFGSYQALCQLTEAELAAVVRPALVRAILAHFRSQS